MNPRIFSSLILAAAVGLAALGVVRAVDLATQGWAPRAAAEVRWFPWAWGTAEDRALLPSPFRRQAPAEPASGASLYVSDPLPGSRPSWVHVMTQYALPDHSVVGVGPTAESPAGLGTVTLDGSAPPLLEARPASLVTRLLELGAFALGLGLAGMLGWALLGFGTEWGREDDGVGFRLATSWVLGLTAAALLAAVAGVMGLPSMAFPVVTAVAGVGWVGYRRRELSLEPFVSNRDAPSPALHRAMLGIALGLTGVFLARIALAPLWSWDHFAIWGMKARRIATVGAGTDLFAGSFPFAQTEYPLGLPLVWVQLAPFTEPGGWLFRLTHGLFGVLLIALVYPLARRLGASRPAAALAAGWTAVSPLLFDTESLGLAEMPLALWLVAGLAWALRPGGTSPWIAGVLLGFLPWIKTEGLPLALLAVVALLTVGPRGPGPSRRWRLGLTLPVLALAVAARVHGALVGGAGRSWLAGDFVERLSGRLADPSAILWSLSKILVSSPWLGVWIAFPVAWAGLAVARGPRHPATALGAVVATQLALYGAVFFVTYLDPLQHIASSFARIASVLGPAAAAVVAVALSPETDPRDPE